MNSRTAWPSKWRCVSLSSALFLAGLTAPGAPSTENDRPRARGGEFGADVLVSERLTASKDLLLPAEEEKKSDAFASFVDGLIAEENADGDKALRAFQNVLNLDPGYTELAIKVAYEQARRGDVDEGISTLKDSIKARPKDPLPALYLSQLYSKYLRKPELALRYAQQALEIDPRNFATHLAVYELHVTAGQTRKAEQVLERAASVPNDDPQYWLQLAELYSKLYFKEDGTAAPPELKKMNAALQKAVTAARDNPAALAKAADFYVLSRQVKEAIPLYLNVLKLKKNAPSDFSMADVQDKLARSFRVNQQRDEAIGMIEQLIRDNPLRYESYELLGELHEEKGDFEKALASYQQMLLIDGGQPVNYLRVADVLLKSKQFDKAVTLLTDARKRFRGLPQVTYSLAVALGQAKRFADSVPLFEEALNEAQDRQQNMLNAAFYFSYGAAAERAGLYQKATELLRKSIELDPASAAEAYNYLGYMWAEKGENLEEAADYIKRALEMDPENPAFLDSLGWLYYQRGDYRKAIEQLLKAAELMKTEDAVVFEHVADAYAKANNVAQALIYWQKAAALDPAKKEITEKIENAKQKVTANPAPVAPGQ